MIFNLLADNGLVVLLATWVAAWYALKLYDRWAGR
jgi:hypothetical protein